VVAVDELVAVHQVEAEVVELAVARLPEAGPVDPELAVVPLALRDQATIPVPPSRSVTTLRSARWVGAVAHSHTLRMSPA
jgi:hypothetical protein